MTSGIDTTGNDILIVGIIHGVSSSPVPHDSKNADSIWRRVAQAASASDNVADLWVASGPTLVVGSGHTFQASGAAGTIIAFGINTDTSSAGFPLDQRPVTNTSASGTSIQAGSITPVNNNSIVIALLGVGGTGSSIGIDSGFTVVENPAGSPNYGGAMAYKIQTTAVAVNPTWSWTGSSYSAALNASFADRLPSCTGSVPNLTAPTWDDIATCFAIATDGTTITVTAGTYSTFIPITISGKHVRIAMGGTVGLTDTTCATAACGQDMISLYESTVGNVELAGPLNITKGGTGYHANPTGVINLINVPSGKPIIVHDVSYTIPEWPDASAGAGDFFIVQTNRGLLYNNTMTAAWHYTSICGNQASFLRHKWSIAEGAPGYYDRWGYPSTFGSADTNGDLHLYVENNTLNYLSQGVDGDDNARLVYRYNTLLNSSTGQHGVDTGGWAGPRYTELYGNTYNWTLTHAPSGSPCGDHPMAANNIIAARGGTMLIHNNEINDYDTGAEWGNPDELHFFLETIDRDSGQYPCWNKVTAPGAGYPAPHQPGWGYITGATNPGSTGEFQDLEPIYIFANTGTGLYLNPSVSSYDEAEAGTDPSSCYYTQPGLAPFDKPATYFQDDREIYKQKTSFDGTSGTGSGARASRPASTTNGVAYWSTDQGGNWSTAGGSNDGCLDKVISGSWSNCWYTPYTYPHPLRNESVPAAASGPVGARGRLGRR